MAAIPSYRCACPKIKLGCRWMDGIDFAGLGTGISQSLSRRRAEGKVAKHSSTAAIHKMRPRFRCSLQPFGRITICYIVQFESLPDDSCDCVNRTRLPGTRTRKFMSARIRRQDSVSSDVCSPFDFFRIHSWPPKGITLTSPSPGDPARDGRSRPVPDSTRQLLCLPSANRTVSACRRRKPTAFVIGGVLHRRPPGSPLQRCSCT